MTTVPDIPVFTDVSVPDEKPPTQYEYACQTCGTELFYAGKGRKPKLCDEHKSVRAASSSRKGSGTNAQLAAQASEALTQLNALVAMGLFLASMPDTASALSDREDTFKEQAYAALLTDPGLSRTILKAGTTGGKISLIIAYGMLGASVAPVGVMEYRANRAGGKGEDRTGDAGTTSTP